MQGDIWVESKPGQGSTFAFTARFGIQQGMPSQRRVELMDVSSIRVLVVDDNSTAREITSSILAHFGMQVDQASSGAAALSLIQETGHDNPYNLVIMDWRMPGMDGVETTKQIQSLAGLDEMPTIIMVTAYGREEASQAAGGVGIRAFLTKPVTASTLFDSVMQAMGKASSTDTLSTRDDARSAGAIKALSGARILLVEDNEINQELALELLTMNGLSVQVANHGQEALELLEKEPFDGVLMDCQMPVMDGYQATRKIRSMAKFQDLPVIAMTANAMAGDKEKVIAAGMNDHIAKPINVNKMFNTMAKWISPSGLVSAHVVNSSQNEAGSIEIPAMTSIDTEKGLQTTQGNKALYFKILTRFSESQENFVDSYRSAIDEQDTESATRLAHSLKGVAGNIGARDLFRAAAELETATEKGDSTELPLAQVADCLQLVLDDLRKLNAPVAGKPDDGAALDQEKVNSLLGDLRALLEEDDIDATDVIEEIEMAPASLLDKGLLKDLSRAIGHYDFALALEILDRIDS